MKERYARNLSLPGWTLETQQRLAESGVLVVGAGGLGSAALFYLAAAGVGRLAIIEDDRVEITNLQRQVLYGTDDLGKAKADVAARRLRALNPQVEVALHRTRLEADNAARLVNGYDLVLDCTDNLETRRLLNQTCLKLSRPWVHGAVSEYYGHVTTLLPSGPCWHCLFGAETTGNPTPPPAGILGPVAGMIGCLQATEALKYLAGIGRLLVGRLLVWDAVPATWDEFTYTKNPDCPACRSGTG